MIILVADTSVLIDLERGGLLEVALSGPDTFATPDLLYDRELADNLGPGLIELGLHVMALSGDELSLVQNLHSHTSLALPDCAALVGARRDHHELLTSDQPLRHYAESQGVGVHGLLWLLDRFLTSKTATPNILHAALTTISSHRRCRLPRDEVHTRLRLWLG